MDFYNYELAIKRDKPISEIHNMLIADANECKLFAPVNYNPNTVGCFEIPSIKENDEEEKNAEGDKDEDEDECELYDDVMDELQRCNALKCSEFQMEIKSNGNRK